MSYLPIRFPERISFRAVGGPLYRTSVVQVASGFEFRDQTAELGLGAWTVSHDARLRHEYDLLLAFFRVAKGRLNTFGFKDWLDYTVTTEQGVFLPTGTLNEWQMYKRYLIGPGLPTDSPANLFFEDRKIQKPYDVTIVGGSTPTTDLETGIVSSVTEPESWSGFFDVPCRFDIDHMEAEIIDKTKHRGGQFITGWQSIPIIEVRL